MRVLNEVVPLGKYLATFMAGYGAISAAKIRGTKAQETIFKDMLADPWKLAADASTKLAAIIKDRIPNGWQENAMSKDMERIQSLFGSGGVKAIADDVRALKAKLLPMADARDSLKGLGYALEGEALDACYAIVHEARQICFRIKRAGRSPSHISFRAHPEGLFRSACFQRAREASSYITTLHALNLIVNRFPKTNKAGKSALRREFFKGVEQIVGAKPPEVAKPLEAVVVWLKEAASQLLWGRLGRGIGGSRSINASEPRFRPAAGSLQISSCVVATAEKVRRAWGAACSAQPTAIH
eukprot:13053395-Alexandrium_andersonii.AAC.1